MVEHLTRLLFVLGLLTLTGCGHEPVGRDFEFHDAKGYALLAFDISVIGDPFPNFSFYLFPYDEEAGTIDHKKRVEMGCGYLCSRGNEEVRFYLKPIDPGTYVVGYTAYQTDFERTLLCYAPQTIELKVEAGTILYMGEMTLSLDHPNGLVMDKLEVLSHGEDHVRARLAKFPNILEVNSLYRPNGEMRAVRNTAKPGRVVIAPVDYVAFERGELQRDDVCIWDYAS